MAAVLALVMVPLFITFTLFFGVTNHEATARSLVAMSAFGLLGTGMLLGLIQFVRGLEPDSH